MPNLKEYQDDEGRTFLLNEKDAKEGGFKAVEPRKNKQAKQPENKQAAPNEK